MSSRAEILAALRANRPHGDHRLPPIPRFALNVPHPTADEPVTGSGATLRDAFAQAFTRMGGTLLDTTPDPLEAVRGRLAGAATVVSQVPEIVGGTPLGIDPRMLAGVDVAVVRAAFGVAETGSVLLTDTALGVNALGYLAQHLVVLLDPADLVATLHHAYDRPDFHHHAYAVFHSGPSATADIEGVLIRGAQGVRSLCLAFVPKASPPPAPAQE